MSAAIHPFAAENGLGGTFAPWANEAPVMTATGDFELLSIAQLESLKGAGKIMKTKTGLDAFVPGFDLKTYVPASKPQEDGGLNPFSLVKDLF
jgi:hypothetical protein